MPFDIEKEFGALNDEFKASMKNSQSDIKSALDEVKRLGDLTAETKQNLDKHFSQQGEMQQRLEEMQVSARDLEQRFASGRGVGRDRVQSLGAQAVEAAKKLEISQKTSFGSDVSLGFFNAITSLPGSAGELLTEQIDSGIIGPEPKRMWVKDLITTGETSQSLYKYFREVSRTGAAGVVPDDGVTAKPRIDKVFEARSAEVVTIAGLMDIHKHMLDDLPALRTDINETLTYEVLQAEDAQILAGDGTGENLSGLITNASAYAMSAREAGIASLSILDRLRLAMLQAQAAGYFSTGHVLNIYDWGKAELLKDSTTKYIFGDPAAGTPTPRLWGRPVVDTVDMPEGDFLTGDFKRAATYYQRQDIEILISSENKDNFDKNMLTVRGEKRATLAVKRPLALVYYSPA